MHFWKLPLNIKTFWTFSWSSRGLFVNCLLLFTENSKLWTFCVPGLVIEFWIYVPTLRPWISISKLFWSFNASWSVHRNKLKIVNLKEKLWPSPCGVKIWIVNEYLGVLDTKNTSWNYDIVYAQNFLGTNLCLSLHS